MANFNSETSTWRCKLAGWLLLSPVILSIFAHLLFRFFDTPTEPKGSADIGVIIVAIIGISLILGIKEIRKIGFIISILYTFVFLLGAIIGIFWAPNWPEGEGGLQIFVHISDPQIWHNLLFAGCGLVWFGIPAYLLYQDRSLYPDCDGPHQNRVAGSINSPRPHTTGRTG
ncbi:MAG: hypothetical protein JJT75_15205, partial [Opitutales bacterium]|nr:hypothetical protein [Opitutales bacterium]